jgi:uncharacterized protein (UPF0261 family)
VIDLTMAEVADMLPGGVLATTEDRFGATYRTGVPNMALSVRSVW